MSAFNGKITKSASVSATVTIKSVTLDPDMYGDTYATFILVYEKTISGSTSPEISIGFNQVVVSPISLLGWQLARGKIAYSSGAQTVTIPGRTYGSTGSLDISDTFEAGETSGKSTGWNLARSYITYSSGSQSVSIPGSSYNSSGSLDISDTFDAGVSSGKSTGWNLARGKIKYSEGSKSVTIPGSSYNSEGSLDITKTFEAGQTSGRAEFTHYGNTTLYYYDSKDKKYVAVTHDWYYK